MVITAQNSFVHAASSHPQTHTIRTNVHTDEMNRINVHGVFQARPSSITAEVLARMERRDRIVLILLDGQRTIENIMHLLHRNELEIAFILVRLLKNGHIDYKGVRRT